MSLQRRVLWSTLALPAALLVTLGMPASPPSWAMGSAGGSVNTTTASSTCFWRGPVDATHVNNAFPDTAVTYWTATISLPAGSRLRITGRFPHSRSMSFNSYDQAGVATDHIDDAAIVPAKGSTDPFMPGRIAM